MAYITLDDIRAEGVTDPPYDDTWITDRISLAQSFIEQLTGCFYEKREDYVFKFDGPGHDLIWLPVPPVSTEAISSVTIDGDEVDSEDYEIIMPKFPDGRYNPKLRKLYGIWPKGKSNIIVTGDFGFVEEDGSTPPIVKDLCKRVTIWNLPEISDDEKQKSSRLVEESLKDYSYKLSEVASGGGFFGDSKIDRLISLLKKPAIKTI